jgi:hypothetical protein
MDQQPVAWLFPSLKPEADRSEFDRDLVAFMRTAYAEGYRPRIEEGNAAIEAEEPKGRCILLVVRGRNGWEPLLGDGEHTLRLGPSFGLEDWACVCVRPPFRAAAHLALGWLRGRPPAELLSDFQFVGGWPGGMVLRPQRRAALTKGPDVACDRAALQEPR